MGKALLIFIVCMCIAVKSTNAGTFNITKELESHPDYSDFNDVLTKSGLADTINSRNSITVCVLTNSQMSKVRSELNGSDPSDSYKVGSLLRPMILLTFIDPTNPDIKNTNEQVASLYQAVGAAGEQEGIANLTTTKEGNLQIIFVGGSNATITKSVKVIAYNLSIVEVSNPMHPIGLLGAKDRPPAVPPPPPVIAPAPAKSIPESSSQSNSPTEKSSAEIYMVETSLLWGIWCLGFILSSS